MRGDLQGKVPGCPCGGTEADSGYSPHYVHVGHKIHNLFLQECAGAIGTAIQLLGIYMHRGPGFNAYGHQSLVPFC